MYNTISILWAVWQVVGLVYYYQPHEEVKTTHVDGKGANASNTKGRVEGQASDFGE